MSGEKIQVMSSLMCTGLWNEVRGKGLGWVFPMHPPWVSQPGHCSGQHGDSLGAEAVCGTATWLHSHKLLEKDVKFWEGLGLQCYVPGIS